MTVLTKLAVVAAVAAGGGVEAVQTRRNWFENSLREVGHFADHAARELERQAQAAA